VSDTRFLEAADRLGSRLCRDAVFAGERCNWIGAAADTPGGRGQTVVQCALGPDLYAGTSGIALFLAHLAVQTNEVVHHRTALAAAAHARWHLAERKTGTNVGFYSGSVGLAFALIDIGKVLDHGVLVEVGLDALRDLSTIGK
jgi:lantibiotic biosynthesis protein